MLNGQWLYAEDIAHKVLRTFLLFWEYVAGSARKHPLRGVTPLRTHSENVH